MPNESCAVVSKTVLVLDCNVKKEGTAGNIDISLKARKTKTGTAPAQNHTIEKPVISLCTQAFLEYCRIFFDLHPDSPTPTITNEAAVDWEAEEKALKEEEEREKEARKNGGNQGLSVRALKREEPRVFVLPRFADPENPPKDEESAAVFMDIWSAIPRDTRQVLSWMAERCTKSEAEHLHASLRFAVKNLAMAYVDEENSPQSLTGRIVVVVQMQEEEARREEAYQYAGRELQDTIASALQQCVDQAKDEELVVALKMLEVTVLRLVPNDSPLAGVYEEAREAELKLPLVEVEEGQVADKEQVKKVKVRMQSHWVSAETLASAMQDLACLHLWLRTVRVTGIPMKEGDNAASTAYDVVLLHRSDDHVSFGSYKEALPLGSGKCMRRNEVALKWKTTEKKLQTATLSASCLHRLTPLQITSSPSQCLVRYLMNDKPVTLVHESDNSDAQYSHMILQQAGDMFLHCLRSANALEDELPPQLLNFYNKSGDDENLRLSAFVQLIENNKLWPKPNTLLPLKPCPTTIRQNVLEVDLSELPDEEGVRYLPDEQASTPIVKTAPGILRSTMLFPYHENTSILYGKHIGIVHTTLSNLISPVRGYLENPIANAKDLGLCRELFRASQVNDPALFPGSNVSWRKDCYQALWGEVMLLAYRSALLFPTADKALLATLQELFQSQPGVTAKTEGADSKAGVKGKADLRSSSSGLASSSSRVPSGSTLPQKRPSDANSFKDYDKNRKQMKLGTVNHTDITHQGTTIEEERKGERASRVDMGLPRSSAGGAFGRTLFHQYWTNRNETPTTTLNIL